MQYARDMMVQAQEEVLIMADAKTYKELQIPKGAAKAFAEALAAQNDGNAPARRKAPAKKKKQTPKKTK